MSQFTKTSLDYERIASNANNFETKRDSTIRFQIVLVMLFGMSVSGCMYPSGLHRLRSLCRKGYQSIFRQHVPP